MSGEPVELDGKRGHPYRWTEQGHCADCGNPSSSDAHLRALWQAGFDAGHKAGQEFTVRMHSLEAPDCDAFEVTPDLPTTEGQS